MSKHLSISGLVQGVGYRAAFEGKARSLQLSGWVRNRMNGTVEAVIAGEAGAVEQMIAWAWRGPAGALVREITLSDAHVPRELDREFDVRPTQ